MQVTINAVLPMDGGKSYQVRWIEVEYQINGGANGSKKVTPYTGMFTVENIKTDDKEQLKVNPLGMYISDFRWEQDEAGNAEKNAQANNNSKDGNLSVKSFLNK